MAESNRTIYVDDQGNRVKEGEGGRQLRRGEADRWLDENPDQKLPEDDVEEAPPAEGEAPPAEGEQPPLEEPVEGEEKAAPPAEDKSAGKARNK